MARARELVGVLQKESPLVDARLLEDEEAGAIEFTPLPADRKSTPVWVPPGQAIVRVSPTPELPSPR